MSADKSDSTPLQSSAVINQAVQTLRDGGLVAFPTETVYGLGADAKNPEAIKKIFTDIGMCLENKLNIPSEKAMSVAMGIPHPLEKEVCLVMTK